MKLLVLSILFVGSNGFFNRFHSPIHMLISTRALTHSIGNFVANELIVDNPVLNDISTGSFRAEQCILYMSLFAVAFYGTTNIDQKKWQSIYSYNYLRKRANMVVLVLFVVFTKNIENAI